jgi:hypothetical protein
MSRKSSIKKVKRDNSVSKNIEANLIMYLYEKAYPIISSRYTGFGIGEADVISISKTDYIYEYEIKISKSDFKKDFIKEKHNNIINEKYTIQNKDGVFYLAPNCFYFVVPENLITIEEIPVYAGLIYFNESGIFTIIKKAPFIHKIKATEKFIRSVAHNLTCKLVFNKIK